MLENFAYWLAALLIVPLGSALLLSWFGKLDQYLLVANLGQYSQSRLGFLGVVVHELSHALVALVVGHRIARLHLFNLKTIFRMQPSLGSVQHYYNPLNLYQVIGNVLIGIAPVYGCSVVIGLLRKFLLNESFLMFHGLSASGWQPIENWWHYLAFWEAPVSGWRELTFILLALTIVITGYGLSKADWSNVMAGIKAYCLLIALIGVVLIWLLRLNLIPWLSKIVYFQLLWGLQGSVYLMIALFGLGVIWLIRQVV